MKKVLPYLACVVGMAVLVVLMPRFNAAQPQGIRLTRSDAVPIADAAARQLNNLQNALVGRNGAELASRSADA